MGFVKTYYKCEKCGKEFDTFDDCWDHEHHYHKEPLFSGSCKPVTYIPYNCNLCGGVDPGAYPLDLHVTMDDAAVLEYTFVKIISGPIQAEAVNE